MSVIIADAIFDSLDGYFSSQIPVGTSAATIASIEDNWRSLANSFALASGLPGGISAPLGMGDGYLAFWTGINSIGGDNDLFYERDNASLLINGKIKLRELDSAPTPPSGYGFLFVKSDGIYFKDDAGVESALIEATDLAGIIQTVEEHKNFVNESVGYITDASDAYGVHVNRTDNPHAVTPAQVGNSVAQWNAEKIHSRVVDFAAPQDNEVYKWNALREVWEPAAVDVGEIPSLGVALDGYLTAETHREQDQLVHSIAESSFTEKTIGPCGKPSAVITWASVAKVLKVREEIITRDSNLLISEVVTNQYDGAGAIVETLTETITRNAKGRVISSVSVLT